MVKLFAIAALVLVCVLAAGEGQGGGAAARDDGDAPAFPAGVALVQGDVDCGGSVGAVDGLAVLRFVAVIGQPAACIEVGDVDCNGTIDATDALKILRHLAGLSVTQSEPCPGIGEPLDDGEPPDDEPLAGPTSGQLIAQALEDGEIDEETALLYEVYAEVDRDQLPAQYRGDDSDLFHGDGLSEALERFDELSPATQDAVRPYIVHPFAPESIENAGARVAGAEEWQSMAAAGNKVLIWWRHSEDQEKAQTIASAMGFIWNELTALMDRPPLTDINEENNGGDGRLDIIITDKLNGLVAATATGYGRCNDGPRPGWIRVTNRDSLPLSDFPFYIAHEFMHILQYSYDYAADCSEYDWWDEASATWAAVHFLYPELKAYGYAQEFLKKPHIPLETFDKANHVYHPYGASVFLFFFTKEHADEGLVRKIQEAMEKYDSLEAIDKTVPGGFDGNWEKFLRYNWNRDWEPLNQYREWQEGFDRRAKAVEDFAPRKVSLAGKQDERIEMIVGLEHLSSEYYHFKFEDDSVSTVVLHNGWTYELEESSQAGLTWLQENALSAEDKDGASLQALVKVEGEDWVVEDLSDKPGLVFCRDEADGRLEELVLIFGNSRHEDRQDQMFAQGLDTTLWVSNYGCHGWEGTAATTVQADGVTTTISANMTWEATGGLFGPARQPSGPPEVPTNLIGLNRFYLPVSGDLSWSISGTDSQGCSHSGSANFELEGGFESGNSLTTWNGVLPGEFYRSYNGLALSQQPATYTISCPGQPPQQGFGAALVIIGAPGSMVSAGGRTLSGTFDQGGTHAEWHLTALRE